MRSQILALVFVALIASTQCQASIFTCLNEASQLANQIKAYLATKDWFNTQALMQIFGKVNAVVSSCGPLINPTTRKALGIDLNLQCIGAMTGAISQIKKTKGSFSGGLNPALILQELANLGINVDQLKSACKIK